MTNDGTTCRILVVIRQEAAAQFIRRALQEAGHHATGVDLPTAPALARAMRPDVVILDLGSPPDPGEFTALRQIRDARPATPIVVLSPRGDLADKLRLFDEGADDFLTKPFPVEELLAHIRVAALGRV